MSEYEKAGKTRLIQAPISHCITLYTNAPSNLDCVYTIDFGIIGRNVVGNDFRKIELPSEKAPQQMNIYHTASVTSRNNYGYFCLNEKQMKEAIERHNIILYKERNV